MQENVVYDTEETLELTGNAPLPKALAQKCMNILHVPTAMCYLHFVSHRRLKLHKNDRLSLSYLCFSVAICCG